VFDVGRTAPVLPAAMRHALVALDRGCAFPGCERPPGWTDAHHIRHWADGGTTCLDNLVLLCGGHHGLIHRGGVRATLVGGVPEFTARDGTLLGRAPPVAA
jgi:hypothetical protein